MKIKLRNTAQVSVRGQLPGAVFRVEAANETTPKDAFWRKMLKNADGIVLVPGAPDKTKPLETSPRETLSLNSKKSKSNSKEVVANV